MSKPSGQLKTHIGIAVIIIALSGAWSYAYIHVRALRASYTGALVTLAKEQARVKSVQTLRNLVTSTKDDREQLAKIFVKEDDLITFLDRLAEVGAHASLDFKITDASVSDRGLALSFEGKGTFKNNLYFLELIEALPQSVSIESTDAEDNSPDHTADDWLFRTSVRLASYVPKETATAATPSNSR